MPTRTVTVNGRDYRVPHRPTVAIAIDGGGPEYLDDGLARGILPHLEAVLANGGTYALGRAHMPTLTNVNNVSIVTGAPPAVHGIAGNHYRDANGEEIQLVDPSSLRAPTVHAVLRRAGTKVLAVTAKEKLRRLLASDGVPTVSAEGAERRGLPAYAITDVPALVGRPNPGIYDWEISAYALEIGLAVHRHVGGLDLLYVSLTDYVQHKHGPGEVVADRFYRRFDELLGAYLEAGFVVGITADHGMHAKHKPDGEPRVHYLQDVLATAGIGGCQVVLPITDPHVRHHGALGSFAWVYAPPSERERARDALAALDGVEEVFTRKEAVVIYQHPPDRIGDLSVAADARTVLGKSPGTHDLSLLEAGLRSHGGRHEQIVPLIVSHPLVDRYAAQLRVGLRNSDLHDVLLNGLA